MQNNVCLSAPYVRLRPWLGFPVAALGNISGVGDAAVGKRHKNLVKKRLVIAQMCLSADRQRHADIFITVLRCARRRTHNPSMRPLHAIEKTTAPSIAYCPRELALNVVSVCVTHQHCRTLATKQQYLYNTLINHFRKNVRT